MEIRADSILNSKDERMVTLVAGLKQQNADLIAALEEIAETDIEFPYDVVKDMQWTASSALKKIRENND